jgi:hypothetical protein
VVLLPGELVTNITNFDLIIKGMDLPPELLEIVKADAPDFVKQLNVMISKIKEVKQKIVPILKSIESDQLQTSKGVSLLELKLHSMLSYITNLSFFALLKVHGQSAHDHPAIDSLIELRVILEKIKPLEGKLKYQIDKLVKIANDADNTTDPVENLRKKYLVTDDDVDKPASKKKAGGSAEADSSLGDPLQFRPNPLAFANVQGDPDMDQDDGGLDNSGVYRPPRVAPMHFDETPREKGKVNDKLKSRTQRSKIINDLQDVLDVRPEEMTAHGTGYSARERKSNRKDDELDRITKLEEETYTRYAMTKDRKKREKALARQSGLSDVQNEIMVRLFRPVVVLL